VQIEADIGRGKSRREGFQTAKFKAGAEAEISRLNKRRARELQRRANISRAPADLAKRRDLRVSVPGSRERAALALRIRGPELGTLSREQMAALAGLAPIILSAPKDDADRGKRSFGGSPRIKGI
jgi:transposase